MKKESAKKINVRKGYVFALLGLISLIIVIIMLFIVYVKVNYNKANFFLNNNNFDEAINLYNKIKFYYAVDEKLKETYYEYGLELKNNSSYEKAEKCFNECIGYKDAEQQLADVNAIKEEKNNEKKYNEAIEKYQEGNFEVAENIFLQIQEYKDVQEYLDNLEILMILQGVWKDNGQKGVFIQFDGWKISKYSNAYRRRTLLYRRRRKYRTL